MRGATAVAEEIDLVLVGGGHAHVAVLRALCMARWAGVRVTLVSREVQTPYSGMLPGHVAGLYDADDIHIDLPPLCAAAGVRLVAAELVGIDPDARRLELEGRPSLRYDVLSLDTGATPSAPAELDPAAYYTPVKPISSFLPRLEALLARIAQASSPLDLLVVGAGAGGVELALSLHARLDRDGLRDRARLQLACGQGGPLASAPARVRRHFERALAQAGIEVHRDCRVDRVEAGSVSTTRGPLAADEVLWATRASAPDWARASGLPVDDDGFLTVRPTLQSESHDEIFVSGDLASLAHAPRPKAGVFAVRAGPVLTRNLARFIRGEALEPWRPQRNALYLVTTGGDRAVVHHPLAPAFAGHWVWRWKDWIDQRFMARHRAPQMTASTGRSMVAARLGGGRTEAGMRCVGCGAKLASRTLVGGLQALGGGDTARFEDAAPLPGDARDIVQTTDGFPLPVDDPWLAGRIAAMHALGDLHAMGARPLAALAFVVLPYMAAELVAEDLAQLMAGVRSVLDAHDCPVTGGHSCEGGAAMVALTLSGRLDDAVLPKGGGRAGDALVLTKAIGTGVLLAATNDGTLPSRYRDRAVAHMLQSNAPALPILRRHGARACTDVTGFGLLGHAQEMAAAAGLGLTLDADGPSILPGALIALEDGRTASLQAENERPLLELGGAVGGRALTPAERVLADPQTCGGLLAAMPPEQVPTALAALKDAGFEEARVVGQLDAEPGLRLGPGRS